MCSTRFIYNNLFPEQVFSISRSIEIILGPIIGGVGTLFGPILGAFVLTGLAEALNSAMTAFGVELPGATQVLYGICLLLVVAGAAGRCMAAFGAAAWRECEQDMTSTLLKLDAVSKRFRGLVAVDQVSLAVQPARYLP